MGNTLIWILLLATLLLFYAALTATAYRLRRRAARAALLAVGWIPSLLLLVPLAVAAFLMARNLPVYKPLEVITALVLSLYVIGVFTIRWFAKRREAQVWPQGRLWLMTAVSAAMLLLTVWNLNMHALVRVQAYRQQAGMVLLSVAPPQVVDAHNAHLVYERARATWGNVEAFDAEFQQVDEAPVELAGDFLEKHAQALALIRQAAEMPAYRADEDFSRPSIPVMLPNLAHMRKMANLLSLAAKYEASEGNTELALADVNRLYRMGEQVGSAPILVSNLVGVGIAAVGHSTLAEVLPKVKSADELEQVRFVTAGSWQRRAARALRGEFAFGLGTICELAMGEANFGTYTEQRQKLPSAGLFMRLFLFEPDVEFYQSRMQQYILTVDEPFPTVEALKAKLPEADPSRRGLFTSILLPSLERYLVTVMKIQNQDDLARMAIAATRYRIEHGGYPESAEQLVPAYLAAIPTDRFGGAPLKLRLREEGLVLYSVDENGEDNGGEVNSDLREDLGRPRDAGLLLRTKMIARPPVEQDG